MPLDHTNATATVSITGLALCCYNLDTSNYEVGFIRHPRHVLTITVETEKPDGHLATTKFELDQSHRIFVETEGGVTPDPPFFTPTTNFDRKAPGQDPEDFQWIVDLDNQLNNGQPVTLMPPQDPVTETRISKPLLYADKEGFALGDLNLVNLDNPADFELFGRISEIIKGDITCEDGGAVILRIEGPLGFSIRLPRIAGKTHKIKLNNACPLPPAHPSQPADTPGDFSVYYSVVESTAGKRFDLKPVEGNVHNADSTCNPATVGGTGRLFPLPT